MNGEGGIGRAEEDLGYLRGDFVTGFDLGGFGFDDFRPDISLGFTPNIDFNVQPRPAPEIFPEVRVTAGGTPQDVIDPQTDPTGTVFESAAPEATGVVLTGEYLPAPRVLIDEFPNPFENTRETDWDRVYEDYVILNAPPEAQEAEMAVDWGDVIGGALGTIAGGLGGGQAPTWGGFSMPGQLSYGSGGPGRPAESAPRTVVVDTVTGKVSACRRRRRRRLLTSSDLADLASLKSIVGGGAAMNAAVVKAVRR